MASENRTEIDAIGKIAVPKDALYGSFTTRARENFNISGQAAPRIFLKALGLLKKAAAVTNAQLKELDPKLAKIIQQATQEYADGRFDDQCQLDPFQAGAGTPYNMNANEVIANRANQILKKPLGSYAPIHPNNHVNMAQSSNDVIPTATRIAVLFQTQPLLESLNKLTTSFDHHAKKHKNQIKVARTHLEDAVPMTVGQEFSGWRDLLKRNLKNIDQAQDYLREIGIGGTAIGSGINAHPKFKETMTKNLSSITKLKLKPTTNTFETNQSMTPLLNFSSSLRALATDLIKIANDLKLLNMGPKAGIAEYILPEVEPGSSIMPGKVNPSIPEALEMTCFQVLGNDLTISLGAQRGQLQLNIFAPLIMFNLLWSLELLTNSMDMFRIFAIEPLIIDNQRCQELFEHSLVVATSLVPYLGYHETAKLVNEALKTGKTIRQLVTAKKLISPEKLAKILSPIAMTEPRPTI